MSRLLHSHQARGLEDRAANPMAEAKPRSLSQLLGGRILHMPDIVRRMPDSTTTDSATFSCAPNDKSARCEKPASSTETTTIPIVLGVV